MDSFPYHNHPFLPQPPSSSTLPPPFPFQQDDDDANINVIMPKSKDSRKTRNRRKGPGVKLSTDPQSVAARERRHRISDRFKILQSLVPGGSKMDTVSMLEEAIHYVKFLKAQIWLHQSLMSTRSDQETSPRQMPPASLIPPEPSMGSFPNSCLDNGGYGGVGSSIDMSYSSLPPLPDQEYGWPFQQENDMFYPSFSSSDPLNFYHP